MTSVRDSKSHHRNMFGMRRAKNCLLGQKKTKMNCLVSGGKNEHQKKPSKLITVYKCCLTQICVPLNLLKNYILFLTPIGHMCVHMWSKKASVGLQLFCVALRGCNKVLFVVHLNPLCDLYWQKKHSLTCEHHHKTFVWYLGLNWANSGKEHMVISGNWELFMQIYCMDLWQKLKKTNK